MNLMEPGNEKENKRMKNNGEVDGEDDGATQEIPNGSNGEAAEAEGETKEKSENANSSNNAITKLQQTTLHLLNVLLEQCKTLETRVRTAIVEALNGKRMEFGKQPGNILRQK